MLSRDDILSSNGARLVPVKVPEWGGEVYLQPLDGVRRDQFEQMSLAFNDGKHEAMRGWRTKLLVYAIVDEEGKRLFKDSDAGNLATKEGAVLSRLSDKVLEISGLQEEAVEVAQGN